LIVQKVFFFKPQINYLRTFKLAQYVKVSEVSEIYSQK